MTQKIIEAALFFTRQRFQKLDITIGLVGYPVPAKGQVGQKSFLSLVSRRQGQLTTLGRQDSATIGLEHRHRSLSACRMTIASQFAR